MAIDPVKIVQVTQTVAGQAITVLLPQFNNGKKGAEGQQRELKKSANLHNCDKFHKFDQKNQYSFPHIDLANWIWRYCSGVRMPILRNLLFFSVIAMMVTACGGGSPEIITGNSSGNTAGGSGNTGTGTTGSVTLQWSAPTTYADTTAASLSDIASYRLYYGPSATNTPNYVNIPDGSATQYTITLPSGTYYFRISAIDSNGYTGLMSPALKKTL